ncbi:hypothetical protein [Loigolactobacillus zhaoyuanensis]|uniref:Uncharacterized protein n=1 Tax=Loigolactobacillus zhaoyuanensis TaxID=2486017 RepID=A0ABW8U8Y6_9LACO|nr:hypothetical protein [Loigolactobacillus zhaoyuanensis]
MTKIKQFIKYPIVQIILFSLIVTWLLPLAFHWLAVAKVIRIAVLFIAVNMLVAIALGIYLANRHFAIWWLLIFPLLFAAIIFLMYGRYGYWFAGTYLILSYLAYSMRKSVLSVAK